MTATTIKITGARIDTSRLDAVSTATTERRTRVTSGARGLSNAIVSEEVLAQTRRTGCRCEDPQHMATLGLPPLAAGMMVIQLASLESGCTKGRWVCARLDSLRRRYGK